MEAQSARGKHAERLLNDPLYIESFEAVEDILIGKWENPPPYKDPRTGASGIQTSPEIREALYQALVNLRKTREVLTNYVKTGESADEQMRKLIEQSDREKSGGARAVA